MHTKQDTRLFKQTIVIVFWTRFVFQKDMTFQIVFGFIQTNNTILKKVCMFCINLNISIYLLVMLIIHFGFESYGPSWLFTLYARYQSKTQYLI